MIDVIKKNMNLARLIINDNLITRHFKQKNILIEWEKDGCPIPPPHIVKIRVVTEYAKRFSINSFIETGTFYGGMIDAVKNIFNEILSIELGEELYEKANNRFKCFKHISIIQGDSGRVLPEMLEKISEPCLFWLDGHYSEGETAKGDKNTPILQELGHIFEHKVKNHVILIDDARCFTGTNDYPTLDELKRFIYRNDVNWNVEIKDDIVRLYK